MDDRQYHEREMQKYERRLKACKTSEHTAIINMFVYHKRMVHELTNNNKENN